MMPISWRLRAWLAGARERKCLLIRWCVGTWGVRARACTSGACVQVACVRVCLPLGWRVGAWRARERVCLPTAWGVFSWLACAQCAEKLRFAFYMPRGRTGGRALRVRWRAVASARPRYLCISWLHLI